MIIFLYGQNSYSLIEYLNELIARYQKKYPDSFNLHKFDLEEADQNEVRSTIKSVSFFKEIKFVIIKNPMAKSALIEKILKEGSLAEQKEIIVLLYQSEPEEKFKEKNQKFFDFLKKNSQTKEFKPPTPQMANKFASTYLTKNKISIKKDILAKIVKEAGSDFWRLRNELDKIAGFLNQENKKEISEENLAKLINFKIDSNIFNIIDAAFTNRSKAIALFENYLNSGGDPLYLLTMIAFQTRNMLIVRELMEKKYQYAEILKKTKMHPFFFKKIHEAAKDYSSEDLKKTFQKTVNFEIAVKTGQTEPQNIFFKIFL